VYDDRIKTGFDAEIASADRARAQGLEGRARVSARRAFALLIRAYFTSHQIQMSSNNVYELIAQFRNLPNISTDILQVADHFLTRVNEDFQLPEGIDLIEEARWLYNRLDSL